MGYVNRDSLRGFLSEHIQDGGLVERLMGLLEPFFVRAESGRYQLAQEAELDPEQVRTAIARATDQKVARVVFVSLEHPVSRPPWMTDKGYQQSLGASLSTSLWDSFGISPWTSLEDSPRDDSLGILLRFNLGNSLGYSLLTSFEVNLGVHRGFCVCASLFYLLGFAITSRTNEVERLIPLIELLPKAVPLGTKKDEPGVWVVLAA